MNVALEYFERVGEAWERAAGAAGTVDVRLRVAGRDIAVRVAGEELAALLLRAFAHLEPARHDPELTILVASTAVGVEVPRPPWVADDYWLRGEVRGSERERVKAAYDIGCAAVSLLDEEAATAVYWLRDGVTTWDRARPFKSILHWWLMRHEIQLTHAAAVGSGGGAVLLGGDMRAGKSTTALACALGGMAFAGEDYVAVSLEPAPTVHSLYCSAKVTPETLRLLPQLRRYAASGPADDDKALLFLDTDGPVHLERSLPLRAVVLPTVARASRTSVREAPPGAVFRAVAISTIRQLPGTVADAFSLTGRLLRGLPTYAADLGSDPLEVAAAIRGVLADEAVAVA
jgi:hypothetical protein